MLRMVPPALLWAGVPTFGLSACQPSRVAQSSNRGLFFDASALPRIQANAQTALLAPIFEQWAAETPDAVRGTIDKVASTQNLIYDLLDACQTMTRAAVVQVVRPSVEREAALRYAVEGLISLSKWDYFLEAGTEVVGILRAPMATARLLFVRDVLSHSIDETLDAALLVAISEKGCMPCLEAIRGMNDPNAVQGWSVDALHEQYYALDLSRWPDILGRNNLRAIPTMGLGLGALALHGTDSRADSWLETAVASSQTFLGFLSPDGSYFEGLSYLDYSLRTLLGFIDAHERLEGSVDWNATFNAKGVIDFILAMQAGQHADGQPDVVNFGDARKSVYPCIPAWLGRRTDSGVAQFAAQTVSEPGYYLDFLWYNPERSAQQPSETLKNTRLDLGWILSRTGWGTDDSVLAFRSGGPANHEHADRNSLFFKYRGERLLTDHIGAAYDWRDPGWLLRLTEAHNAVLINGHGHQYHNGEEGTNESQAEAHIVRYEDQGDRIWWTSDATSAYHLVDPNIRLVTRTVFFAKPDIVLVVDRMRMEQRDATVELRFFPDNRDGRAELHSTTNRFQLARPQATLHGFAFGTHPIVVNAGQLDLPAERGVFPYVAVAASKATEHTLITVLIAQPTEVTALPECVMEQQGTDWLFRLGNLRGRIMLNEDVTELQWEDE